jgi:pimeloyl-ACP methyl ester carboxylesterase
MSNPILAHTRVAHEGAAPDRWLLLLHGVFGMGQNFRTFAKALVAREPRWGVVLVDLRGHGASQGFAPPHTLASAAADVSALVASIDVPVRGVAGHSFGGKVTLSYLARKEAAIARAFVLDSVPGARPGALVTEETGGVLALLERIPAPLASREAFMDLCREAGLSKPIADWLAMNVRRADDGYRLRLDLPAIRAMLVDYCESDFWSTLADPSLAERVDLVIGGASRHYSDADVARARALADAHPHLVVTTLEKAGHWLHVDDPAGLLDAMATALRY